MFDFDNVLQTNKVYWILTTNNYVVFVAGEDSSCLLYTSDAADDLLCVDLGGRRIIKKKIETTEE